MFEKLGKLYDAFLDSKVGKAFTVITSNAVGRVLTLASVILPLAGITIVGLAAPIAPALAIPISVVAIVGVVAGAIIDTVRTRNTRHLLQEHKSLTRLNKAVGKHEKILQQYSKLQKIFPLEVSQKGGNDPKSLNSKKYHIPSAFVETAFNQAAYIPLSIVSSLGNPISLAIASIKALFSFGMETSSKMSLLEAKYRIKQQVNEGREKAPAYKNLQELKQIELDQRIQTLALKKLVKTISIDEMSEAEIKINFNVIKNEIIERANKINKTNRFSIFKDFGRAHNPFSQYNSSQKLEQAADQKKIITKMKHKDSLIYESNYDRNIKSNNLKGLKSNTKPHSNHVKTLENESLQQKNNIPVGKR